MFPAGHEDGRFECGQEFARARFGEVFRARFGEVFRNMI